MSKVQKIHKNRPTDKKGNVAHKDVTVADVNQIFKHDSSPFGCFYDVF